MTQTMTVNEAADTLGVNLSTVHRRCRVLGLEKTKRDDGQTLIDLDALKERWAAHMQEVDAGRRERNARLTKWLTAAVDQDMLDEIDAIAESRSISRSESARRLIAEGTAAFYTNGRRFSDG